jgi:hypothetical protein
LVLIFIGYHLTFVEELKVDVQSLAAAAVAAATGGRRRRRRRRHIGATTTTIARIGHRKCEQASANLGLDLHWISPSFSEELRVGRL